MYKNQLQELAQRSCFDLPTYTCTREGPDHAPRFKSCVNFNGENFESPSFCTTLRQAEHAAAEVALNYLAHRGPASSLAARVLDETGVYKNLLQEVSQRVGASLPVYKAFKSGTGHLPIFTCTVELAGIIFTGDPAKSKKQSGKNAALTAWFSLKQLVQESADSSSAARNDELEHVTVARALQNYLNEVKKTNPSFPIKFPVQKARPPSIQMTPPVTKSKILHSIPKPPKSPKPQKTRRPGFTNGYKPIPSSQSIHFNGRQGLSHKFPAAQARPHVAIGDWRSYYGIAQPVTVRTVIPSYCSASLHPLPVVSTPQMKKAFVNAAPSVPPLTHGMQPFTAPTIPNGIPTPGHAGSSSSSSVSDDDIRSLPEELLQESVVLATLKGMGI